MRETVTTKATSGKSQMLNLATTAAGEVTPGHAVKPTETLGATARATVVGCAAGLNLRRSVR
jgi:hypothetical protein